MEKPFRATLWFKKGELDACAAADAADGGDELHPGAVDLLPIEDRYLDDGSVTAEDAAAFSLRTGGTMLIPCSVATGSDPGDVGVLVRDIKRGRARAFAFLVAATFASAAIAIVAL